MCLVICFCMKRKFLNAFERNKQNSGTGPNQVCCVEKRLDYLVLARLDHTSLAQPNTSACPSMVLHVRVKPVQILMSIFMLQISCNLEKGWIILSVYYQGQMIQIRS